MKINCIVLLMSAMMVILSCTSCGGKKKITYQSGEVTVKATKNSDKTITRIFYRESKEVAKKTHDREGNIIETTGTIPDGTVREYYESGKLKEEFHYQNGKLEGLSIWYYETGIIKGEKNHKDGTRNGITKWYYDTGSLGAVYNYKKGRLEGNATLYWENGNVKAEHYYEDGKREGINKQYYNSGELRFIYMFKDGRRISKKTYNKTGSLLRNQSF